MNTNSCGDQCAPSAAGCMKCQVMPQSQLSGSDSIFFGSKDAEAPTALQKALTGAGFEVVAFGSLLKISNVKDRLSEISTLLRERLTPYAKNHIKAAYTPVATQTIGDAVEAMISAVPLAELIENLEHEWVRTALSGNWLFSVFHPIINARSGEVFANEALLRARIPKDDKVMGAGQIIGACEKLDLMHQLDQRARRCAIRAAAEHVPSNSRIFINFLPNTIYDPEVCLRTTMETAAECDVPMSRLVFEVVETEKIPDMKHLCEVLDYYRNRGVGTAIDDMGAGFTGLDYVTALEPDFVKLDREFVVNAAQSADGRAALDNIVGASRDVGARVIAEGIETHAQMSMCVDAGVDYLQGFLFAKPACPPQAVKFPSGQRRAA